MEPIVRPARPGDIEVIAEWTRETFSWGDYVADAIATGNPAVLQGYSQALDDMYADYQREARRFAIVIGYPAVIRRLTHLGMRSRPLMEWALKVMANLLEPEERGLSERIYGTIERIVKVTPDPLIK